MAPAGSGRLPFSAARSALVSKRAADEPAAASLSPLPSDRDNLRSPAPAALTSAVTRAGPFTDSISDQ